MRKPGPARSGLPIYSKSVNMVKVHEIKMLLGLPVKHRGSKMSYGVKTGS